MQAFYRLCVVQNIKQVRYDGESVYSCNVGLFTDCIEAVYSVQWAVGYKARERAAV